MPKIRGNTIMCWRYVRCNFSGGWGTPDPTGIPSPDPTLRRYSDNPQSGRPSTSLARLGLCRIETRSPRCLDQFRAFDACHTSTQSEQFSPNFYYFYISLSVLKIYWVVLTADCRNSVCRNRVCRNSVCLPAHT